MQDEKALALGAWFRGWQDGLHKQSMLGGDYDNHTRAVYLASAGLCSVLDSDYVEQPKAGRKKAAKAHKRKLEALAHNTGAPGHFNLHLLGKERSEWVKTRPGTTLNPPGHPDHNAMLDRPDETWTW